MHHLPYPEARSMSAIPPLRTASISLLLQHLLLAAGICRTSHFRDAISTIIPQLRNVDLINPHPISSLLQHLMYFLSPIAISLALQRYYYRVAVFLFTRLTALNLFPHVHQSTSPNHLLSRSYSTHPRPKRRLWFSPPNLHLPDTQIPAEVQSVIISMLPP